MDYTKGQWEIYTGHDGKLGETLILAPNPVTNTPNFVIAKVSDIWPNHIETEANAHLIAAAPAMYEALRVCITSIQTAQRLATAEHLDGALSVAKEALAKANGEK